MEQYPYGDHPVFDMGPDADPGPAVPALWGPTPPGFVPMAVPPRRGVNPVLIGVLSLIVLLVAALVGVLIAHGSGSTSGHAAAVARAEIVPDPAPSSAMVSMVSSAIAAAPPVPVATENGVFRSGAAHYRVRFPDSVVSQRGPVAVVLDAMTLDMRIVVDPARGLTVESMQIPPDGCSCDGTEAFEGTVQSFTTVDKFTELASRTMRVDGQQAHEGDLLTPKGGLVEIVSVVYPDGWFYVLVGPRGPSFDDFVASFHHTA